MDFATPDEKISRGYRSVQRGRAHAMTAVGLQPTKKWKKKTWKDKGGLLSNYIRGAIGAMELLTPKNIQSMLDNRKKKGLVFPGSKYIGPGNPMNLGEPLSDGDALAYEHDMAYNRLLDAGVSPAEVYLGATEADNDAIDGAMNVLSNHADVGAVAVLAGLSTKRSASKLLKGLYDKIPSAIKNKLPLTKFKEFYPDPVVG